MKRIVSRKRRKNHLEIIIKGIGKEEGDILEKEIKRAVVRCRRSLDKDISFEIFTVIDRNNRQAM